MVFRVNMFDHFISSDSRGLPYLSLLYELNKNIKIITTKPVRSGRGKKLKQNKIELFCIDQNINYEYFDPDKDYSDLNKALCVSFKNIFSKKFLCNNKSIFNLHLSLLPKYRGPSPIENTILNSDKYFGYTIFKINEEIDAGPILYQKKFKSNESMYANDYYAVILNHFKLVMNDTSSYFNKDLIQQSNDNLSKTKKFIKEDYCINKDSVKSAKLKIKAFNVIGPAYFYDENDNLFKIHSYSECNLGLKFKLNNGLIYPKEITPEGKKRMLVEDYLRGIK